MLEHNWSGRTSYAGTSGPDGIVPCRRGTCTLGLNHAIVTKNINVVAQTIIESRSLQLSENIKLTGFQKPLLSLHVFTTAMKILLKAC